MTTTNKALGLYLHIPFCIQKCNYCDFLSLEGINQDIQVSYTEALKKEIGHYSKLYHNKYYVDSIFIGGGTPSIMDEALTAEILEAVRAGFHIEQNAEITIESNPKTLTKEKLDAYLAVGINRLSIGVQSLHDGLLKYMGRVHNAEDALGTYRLARERGFQNINLDLMFAIPGQTMEIWEETAEHILALQPEHISFYSLQLEEGTPFFQMFTEGSLKEIDDELDREMYHWTRKRLLEGGYLPYEISNAAKKGFACRHNLKYWSMDDYLGIGLGAHSYMNGVRFSNQRDMNEYLKAKPREIVQWTHQNTEQDTISEYIFTGMRKTEGISLNDFKRRFGQEFPVLYSKETEQFMKEGLIEIKGEKLRFTPKGIDLSNRVLAEFV